MRQPSAEDAKRCFEVRCRSKRGESVSADDHDFVVRMFERYTEWFTRTEVDVFNATVPFGSSARVARRKRKQCKKNAHSV